MDAVALSSHVERLLCSACDGVKAELICVLPGDADHAPVVDSKVFLQADRCERLALGADGDQWIRRCVVIDTDRL